jgi:hypothetical protein
MTNLQVELSHLINLMAAPYRESWKTYCWAKAVYLSESNPHEYSELPRLLKEAMLQQSSTSEASDTASSATTPEPPNA